MEQRKKRSLSAIVFAQSINLSELRATQREKKNRTGSISESQVSMAFSKNVKTWNIEKI